MKNKKVSIPGIILVGVSLLGWFIFSCQKFQDLPDDFENAMDLKINADLKLVFGTITVLDAASEQLVTEQALVKFKKAAKDSAMIISIEGNQVDTAKFTGGMFQFALNKGYTTPIDLPVVVWANGYDTFYTVITLSQAQAQQFSFKLHKKSSAISGANGAPVSGIGVKDTVLGFIGADNKVPANLLLNIATSRQTEITVASPASDLMTTISIAQGTIFYNKKGEPLQGEIIAKSKSFDVSNPAAFANLPGSLLATAPGTNPNEPMAISALGGIPVQVSGVPGTSGTQKTAFVSAGLLSLDMTVNGVPVDSFSLPLSVKMEIADSIVNPSTGAVIKDADTIDLWSIDKDGTTWQWEGKVLIKGPAIDGKFSASFLVKHLSSWNLDWHYSEVCYTNELSVTGVPANIALYVQPAIIYPSGLERGYYGRQRMDGTGSMRNMTFWNVPKGYALKFSFYTSQYGALAFQDTVAVSNNCAPMVIECPPSLVSDQLKLKIIATDSSGVPIGPQWLYLYGNVQGSYESFYAYSQNDTFDMEVAALRQSTFSIYSNGVIVGTKIISGKYDPEIIGGVLKVPVNIPAKCNLKVAIHGAFVGSYLYLDAIIDSKGAYPRRYSQYFYIAKSDTTLVLDQLLKDRYVKISLYYMRGVQIPVIKDYEFLMNNLYCGQSLSIDLKSFFCRPKIVLHNSSAGGNPVNIDIRTYPPAIPGSATPGNMPYSIFTRTNTTDTVFYPEGIPALWPSEIIVTGTKYDSCSLRSVVEVGRMNKQVLDTSYVNWTKSITVNVDNAKLTIPSMVKIPINISIKCSNMEITPSIAFYYKLNCSLQNWNGGYLSMGKATLSLEKGRTYIFAVYDSPTSALKQGTITITDDLILRANASKDGINLYNEITSPELKAVLDGFCGRMGK